VSVREIFQAERTVSHGHPHPAITQPTTVVTEVDLPEARALASDLLDTMSAQPLCVGLAANQIGSTLQVAVIELSSSDQLVLVNPKLVSASGKKDRKRESCMSLWGLTGDVERRSKATVVYQDLDLNTHEQTFEGFVARVVQHEIDHLEGRLFIEHVVGEPSATELFEGYSPVP
jgi:peptide deformylase